MKRTHGQTHYTPEDCFGCRVLAINFAPVAFQPHYNNTVGQYVNNDREFRDALKRHSDRNSVATGLAHDYQPTYPGDVQLPYPESTELLEAREKKVSEVFK